MLVANHTSMTDIMAILWLSPNPFVFVGKMELAKIPIFGLFYKRTNILVDRGNAKSRKEVFDRANERLKQGISICIFPEGGVPDDYSVKLADFKDGAFRLAIEHQIPIVPIILYDNKKRLPYKFDVASPGKMRMQVEEFIPTKGMQLPQDRMPLRQRTRNIIKNQLNARD
jgi:1-acyl-sn-glycerol-3-phosphate acyltransferase